MDDHPFLQIAPWHAATHRSSGQPTFLQFAEHLGGALKSGAKRDDFDVDARVLHRTLLSSDYTELPITGEHAVAVSDLPPLHKDPFDRLLIAQCIVEGITLLTADRIVARYPGSIRRV